MNYCTECDIAYEESSCPLCAALEEISRLEKEVEKLEKEL